MYEGVVRMLESLRSLAPNVTRRRHLQIFYQTFLARNNDLVALQAFASSRNPFNSQVLVPVVPLCHKRHRDRIHTLPFTSMRILFFLQQQWRCPETFYKVLYQHRAYYSFSVSLGDSLSCC